MAIGVILRYYEMILFNIIRFYFIHMEDSVKIELDNLLISEIDSLLNKYDKIHESLFYIVDRLGWFKNACRVMNAFIDLSNRKNYKLEVPEHRKNKINTIYIEILANLQLRDLNEAKDPVGVFFEVHEMTSCYCKGDLDRTGLIYEELESLKKCLVEFRYKTNKYARINDINKGLIALEECRKSLDFDLYTTRCTLDSILEEIYLINESFMKSYDYDTKDYDSALHSNSHYKVQIPKKEQKDKSHIVHTNDRKDDVNGRARSKVLRDDQKTMAVELPEICNTLSRSIYIDKNKFIAKDKERSFSKRESLPKINSK